MQIKILPFGITKEIVGDSVLDFSAPDALTVGSLKQSLFERYPKLQHLNSLAIAVNGTYAEEDLPVQSGDEVVLIPPVSGG